MQQGYQQQQEGEAKRGIEWGLSAIATCVFKCRFPNANNIDKQRKCKEFAIVKETK